MVCSMEGLLQSLCKQYVHNKPGYATNHHKNILLQITQHFIQIGSIISKQSSANTRAMTLISVFSPYKENVQFPIYIGYTWIVS